MLIPHINFDHRLYLNGTDWLRATQNIEYKRTFANTLGMVLGHKHYLYNLGGSPFNFENYLFVPKDELLGELVLKLGTNKVGVETTHYLPDLEPKDIDYIISLGFDCYDIIFTYRAMRSEVQFGFNLLSR